MKLKDEMKTLDSSIRMELEKDKKYLDDSIIMDKGVYRFLNVLLVCYYTIFVIFYFYKIAVHKDASLPKIDAGIIIVTILSLYIYVDNKRKKRKKRK
ncbi:MAG: hypothetical protein RR929_04115 [Erysipelotrichaceae bacterium]